jgi:hypothetical protein
LVFCCQGLRLVLFLSGTTIGFFVVRDYDWFCFCQGLRLVFVLSGTTIGLFLPGTTVICFVCQTCRILPSANALIFVNRFLLPPPHPPPPPAHYFVVKAADDHERRIDTITKLQLELSSADQDYHHHATSSSPAPSSPNDANGANVANGANGADGGGPPSSSPSSPAYARTELRMTIHDDDTPGLRLTTHRVAALEGGEWVAYGVSLRSQPSGPVREIGLCYTCWWYSLCNFQYRQHYENTCSYNVDC